MVDPMEMDEMEIFKYYFNIFVFNLKEAKVSIRTSK